MTSDQRKEVTNALVAFVLDVTNTAFEITEAEATALPAVLDFLVKTDSSEILSYIPVEQLSENKPPSINLHNILRKFAKEKE